LASLGHPYKFQRVLRIGSVTARHLVVGVSQTLRRWTEGATYIRQGDHPVGHWPTFLVYIFGNAMIFIKDNKVLFKILKQDKCYSARQLLKELYYRQWSRLSLDQLLRVQKVTDFLFGNSPLKLIVFKLSYLSNATVYFVETCAVYVK